MMLLMRPYSRLHVVSGTNGVAIKSLNLRELLWG